MPSKRQIKKGKRPNKTCFYEFFRFLENRKIVLNYLLEEY